MGQEPAQKKTSEPSIVEAYQRQVNTTTADDDRKDAADPEGANAWVAYICTPH